MQKKNKSFFIETYGCQMNLSDSGRLKDMLTKSGISEDKSFSAQTDAVIINTCSVRHSAENRIYGRLGRYKKLKESSDFVLILMGCMAEKDNEDVFKYAPHVDYVVGTHHMNIIPELILNDTTSKKSFSGFGEYTFSASVADDKYKSRAFVNIIHGCSNFCSYCIVPHVRGAEISRNPEDIVDDIKRLVDEGIKEAVLLGQNVNSYGLDCNYINFAELLIKISKETSLKRLKFMTSHPKDFSFDLIDTIADTPLVCHDIHLPLQSASDSVLKLMNRKYTFTDYMSKLEYLNKKLDNPRITTDLLVGFPGETQSDFEETLNAVKNIRYHNAFMYKYSRREGTKACDFIEKITSDEKQKRLQELILVQNKITLEKYFEQVNTVDDVLIESQSKNDKNELRGTSSRGFGVVVDKKGLSINTLVKVKITQAKGHTLKGEILKDG
jgi:tRNA-2-methylthio-N6-dimethylallyladenosine synthase